MSFTKTNNYLAITKWQKQFLFDYVAGSGYKKYMGPDSSNIIRVVDELKNGGETVVTPLAAQLRGSGVSGGTTLVGNEESMGEYADRLTVTYFRHAVAFGKDQTFRTDLDLMNAGRKRLKDWSAKKLKLDITTAYQSIPVKSVADADGNTVDVGVNYASATDDQKNAYLAANTDRIMVGNSSAASKASASGSWANTLKAMTAANDKITAATLHNAREMALQTGLNSSFGVNPYQVDDDSGEAVFIYFCGPEQFRDLKSDPEIQLNYRHAAELGFSKSPLFQSGDLWLDGILIRRIDAIGLVGNVGGSNAPVARGFLCGQSSVTVAYGQDPTPITDVTDFGFRKGVGIEEIRGVKKTSFNGVNYGVVDVLTTTTPATF
jgi:hypothetical protein